MGFTKLVAAEALNEIKILGRQAKSYAGPMGRAGIRLSKQITRDALGHGLSYYAGGGALAGAAIGAGAEYLNNPRADSRSMIRAGLKGGLLGGAAGGGLRMGMSAYGMRGGFSARALMRGADRTTLSMRNFVKSHRVLNATARGVGLPNMFQRAGGAIKGAYNSPRMATAAGWAGRAYGAVTGGATYGYEMAQSAYQGVRSGIADMRAAGWKPLGPRMR